MLKYLPNQIAQRAVIVYVVSLAVVSIVFASHAMSVGYMALGCLWVFSFFFLVCRCSRDWQKISGKLYVEYILLISISLRVVWVFASYLFYSHTTGIPFEFQARDSIAYHEDAVWLAGESWSATWNYLFGRIIGISDSGYPFFLTVLYRITGPSIIIPRLVNALLGGWTCILIYRMSTRTFGEEVARLAGIMMAFMPNLIIYCGYHLKETVMLFLLVACLERTDFMIRNKRLSFLSVLVPTLLAGSLFLFRTALGAAAVLAFATAILVSSAPGMKRISKRLALIGWSVLALVVFAGGTITSELEGMWEGREDNLANKRTEQTMRGNQWAKYATGSVMAPMIVILPFATMVDVDEQYSQQAKSGGNYIRNFLGFFVFLAIYEAIRRKKWRDFVLIGSFIAAYLGVVSLSGFSNSERFLLPGLPGLIMMWAYGVSVLRRGSYKLMNTWSFVVLAMEIAWAFFKLGSRGIL